MTKATVYPVKLDKADAAALGGYAQAVWDDIAGDTMQMVAEEGKRSISRAGVLELVIDADRLDGEIRRAMRRASEISPDATRVAQCERLLRFLNVAGYARICRVLRPAFDARYGT